MTNLPRGVLLESSDCPIGCTKNDRLVIEAEDRLHGIPGRFRVVECAACGLMRTNPRPTPMTIGAYYPSDYGPYQAVEPVATSRRSKSKQRIRDALGLDTRKAPPIAPGKLLEIGCASGSYMVQMQHLGWIVEGIEYSNTVAEQARARGLTVQTATLESALPPQEPVDIVAAWMVLEHLHEPVAALGRVRGWVRPNGYLIASVPDASSLERRLFGDRWYALQLPTHLFHYTPKSIEAMLDAAGWQLTRLHWQRNCNNLLKSLETLATDRHWPRLLQVVRWFGTARSAHPLRLALAWLLGATHQSGRMEIWARPALQNGTPSEP